MAASAAMSDSGPKDSLQVALDRTVRAVQLAARVLRTAALGGAVGAAIIWLALLPSIEGDRRSILAALLAAVLLAAPVRVAWHARRMVRVYGDTVRVRAELSGVVTDSAGAARRLEALELPRATGPGVWRRAGAALRTIRELHRIYSDSGLAERIDRLSSPVEPGSLALTGLAAGISVALVVLAPIVVVAALAAAALA